MGKDKASGPDGLPPSFYSHHWNTVSEDVFEIITHFFTHLELPGFINDTSLVLIPKNEAPLSTKDYRPIALCNVSYKIISKIIASRLRGILPRIISPNQATFIRGRSIAENSMIAREIVHSMKKRKNNRGFMMIKLDLEKAYDKMDWDFILLILSNMGFTNPFLGWIRACISVQEIKLLLNGSIAGKIKPRGLRQGDPLSPSLFILAAETLSRLLLDKEKRGQIKGIKVGRHGPTIDHLMFADDIMLFGQASTKEAKAFKECLATYCEWSGQSINLHKSSVFFSCGVPRGRIQTIKEILRMKQMTEKVTYLRLPLFNTSRRTSNYNNLVDRVLLRIKDVIPTTTANKIDKALRDFWWGDTEEKRVLHCVAWETLCKPKTHGSLGFRTTEATNQAFLMKWAWKVLTDDSSLWKHVLGAKYLKNHNFLDLDPQASDSVLWKAILKARNQLHKGMCRKIGNSESTSIWFHPWIPLGNLQPQPRLDATQGVSLVCNFIHNFTWREDLVHQWFQPEDARRILNITKPNHPVEDSWLWTPESNGKFTIRSAYRTIKNLDQGITSNEKWWILWGTKMHSRLKMLWWRILSNCLLTRGKLQLFAGLNDPNCPLCSLVVEDSLHIFWKCHLARSLWFDCCWSIRTCSFNFSNWEEWINWFKITDNRPKDTSLHAFLKGAAIIFEKIWSERNKVVHQQQCTPTKIILQLIDNRLQKAFQTLQCGPAPMMQWLPPPEGWFICNTDVAIDQA
ncbi:uncharacterized protein LOC133031214 [Cannabis sativa]|uniref:uncharacterized protein LOC133031214 n=1 Tax=Cannabis sativa TaxID=3483 RepID=UPI0029CA51EE|nr:uncharacterized protein LOC133031214 [Cannabis sativa]